MTHLRVRLSITAIMLCAGTLVFAAPQKQTLTGIVTDSMCEKADHKDMKAKSDAACVIDCVKSMGAKYVLFDGKQAWELSDQKAAAKFAAQKVTVTGTADAKAKTIKVESIAAAK